MTTSLTQGFLLGLGAAIPLGPINILIMNNALKDYKTGVAIGFGAMSADILYLSLTLMGFNKFLNHPLFLNITGVFGSFFLLYLAYGIYKSRANKSQQTMGKVQTKKILKIYAQGFILTLLNPYTVIFWFSIAGYVANKHLSAGYTLLGLVISITLWTTMMPYFVHRSKHRISPKTSNYLSTISAFILLGFAISLLIHILF